MITPEIKQKKLTENTPKKQRVRGKPFTKDDPRINRDGRPKGSKNFSTLMDETVEEIAKVNNISESEVWRILIKKAYSEAKEGNYMFYKDILDRYYGKAKENVELSMPESLIDLIKGIQSEENNDINNS